MKISEVGGKRGSFKAGAVRENGTSQICNTVWQNNRGHGQATESGKCRISNGGDWYTVNRAGDGHVAARAIVACDGYGPVSEIIAEILGLRSQSSHQQ